MNAVDAMDCDVYYNTTLLGSCKFADRHDWLVAQLKARNIKLDETVYPEIRFHLKSVNPQELQKEGFKLAK